MMSGTTSSGVESFGTVDILELGRTYRVLSEELVCKALDEEPGDYRLDLGPQEEIEFTPQERETLADILANQIVATLDNLCPDGPENETLDLIEDTFAVACLKKHLEDQTNCANNTLRKAFYERMCSPDPGVTHVTHSEETTTPSREAGPIVEAVTGFLLDENRGGAKIPGPVQSRAEELWDLLLKKAEEWGPEYNMSEMEACREVIAATIAVEVRTGGDPDHIRPYERYIYKERGATWSQLDEDPSHEIDKRLVKWYEDKYDKDSR
jgi:hypothetical protein